MGEWWTRRTTHLHLERLTPCLRASLPNHGLQADGGDSGRLRLSGPRASRGWFAPAAEACGVRLPWEEDGRHKTDVRR